MDGLDNQTEPNIDNQNQNQNPDNNQQSQANTIDDTAVIEYLRTAKGKEINSIDDLFQERVVEKEKIVEINPYKDLLDDEDKQYLTYKKETGRSRDDFYKLNTDFDKINPVELARERLRTEAGKPLSNAQCDALIERRLQIDVSDLENLDETELLELEMFTNDFRKQKKQEQEKYKQPISKSNNDIVQLENGTIMQKSAYENMQKAHQTFIADAQASLNSVKESVFNIKIDENGTLRDVSFNYEFSDDERHSMLSNISNVEGLIDGKYRTEQGFKHKEFAEDLFWLDANNRQKAIAKIIEKAIAENTISLLGRENNVNFNRQRMPSTAPNGTTIVPLKPSNGGFSFNI